MSNLDMAQLERCVKDDPAYDPDSNFSTSGQGDTYHYCGMAVTKIGLEVETDGTTWVWVWNSDCEDVMPYFEHELTKQD